MAPLRVSTTKSEWLPDDPTAFVPTRLWKLPFITTWDDSRNQNRPTDSAEEALFESGFPGVVWWACRLGLLNWNYGVVVSGGIGFRLGPDSPGVATTLGLAFGEFGLLHVIH